MIGVMSTRAIIACTTDDGRWRGVWNHGNGQTQHLGRALIRLVAKHKGALATVVSEMIEGCPEGWSELGKKRSEDPVGFLSGAFDGVIASCDAEANALCFDAHYLYLFHPPKRRLYVFEIKDGPMRPFGMVTFDDAGAATPRAFPRVEE